MARGRCDSRRAARSPFCAVNFVLGFLVTGNMKYRNDKAPSIVEEFMADENEYSSTIEEGQNQADNEGNGEDSEDEGSNMEL
ncbi:hypothetical protein Zm00014a_024062 [Zea mays]|uniref:Uncharacterized protein n=1 Tax=Zea mays TaxID=4577 RepID=A0A3L6EA26_MAIZE|nr:hypothetical protein Zm00014a_024062 [Zea mays]